MNPVTLTTVAEPLIRQALAEDITNEDVSTAAIMPDARPAAVDLIAKADGVLFVNRYDPPETAAAAVTASAAVAGTRTVKAAAPAALPQTGDGFPIEALAAAFCASVIGFGTAWKRR